MISAGIDIGSTTTKAVILDEDTVRASIVLPSGDLPAETAKQAFASVLSDSGLTESDMTVIATTGYGRRMVDMGDIVMTEIKACAAGVLFRDTPNGPIHTIIDVGGQDTKVIAIDDDGDIEDFSMNDKCAAGTGRFLEVLAHKLRMTYEEFVAQALTSDTMIQMNATCAVFAESEVVGLLARKVAPADIAAAAHDAIAQRVASMTRRVGQRGGFCFVGGGARNGALVKAVEENLNQPIYIPDDAQSITALGAAIGAQRRYRRLKAKGKI
jgi:(R)-2-hydroxyacyl-CoA dehydratese activating ATPase